MRRIFAFCIGLVVGWRLWDALGLNAEVPATPAEPPKATPAEPPKAAPAEPQPQGYCTRCKAQRAIRDPHPDSAKDGRPMLRGTCATCGAKIARFIKADEPSAS
ncbi:hypothetical protein F8S13_07075 [Chloroflexia bacterium SDU3-3]|nr:hypothetical protein F8S13_07075 [Chloroflexia bacterium SDU3-3]